MSKTTQIILWIVVAIIVIVGIYYGVNKKQTTLTTPSSSLTAPITKETIKIGATLPLTGDVSNLGVDAKNAIELAVKEINQTGGIKGSPVEVVFEDDKCDPKLSVDTVNKLINLDKVKIIFGPFCSGASLSAVPIAQQNKVLMISGSATNPKLSNFPLYFRTIPSDAEQGKFGAEYVFNKLNKRKVAIAYVQNDYGVGLKDAFKKRFEELGGKVVVELEHQEGAVDLRTNITKIKNANPELIYLVAYPKDGGNFLKQLYELNVKVPVFGSESLESPDIIEIAKEAAEGVIFTRAKEIKNENYINNYKSAYNVEPEAYGVFYYDAAKIIFQGIESCNLDIDCLRNFLVNNKFTGFTGDIDFNENGDVINKEFMLKIIKKGKFEVYEQ
jgi:branched-chain amino acid transport system substrate-binding protein